MTCDGHPPRFVGMFVLAMAAFLGKHEPTVFFNYTQNFANSHDSNFLGLFNIVLWRRKNPCKSWVWGRRHSIKIWRLRPKMLTCEWRLNFPTPNPRDTSDVIIFALDLGKFNTMCCIYNSKTRKHEFINATTERNFLATLVRHGLEWSR